MAGLVQMDARWYEATITNTWNYNYYYLLQNKNDPTVYHVTSGPTSITYTQTNGYSKEVTVTAAEIAGKNADYIKNLAGDPPKNTDSPVVSVSTMRVGKDTLQMQDFGVNGTKIDIAGTLSDFQKSYGMAASGVVDKETIHQLMSIYGQSKKDDGKISLLSLPSDRGSNSSEKSNCDMEFFMPDPNKVSTFMRKSIDYLLEKVIAGKADWCTFNGTESVWSTPEDFEDLLDTYLGWLQDPTISFIDSLVLRGEKIVDGTLQAIGGGTQAVAGYGIATIGSWGIVTVPVGIIVGADGLSNAWEGREKVIKGLTTLLDSSYSSFNPIRDWAFKGVLGENAGANAYNYFTLGTGIVAFAKSGFDIYNSGAVKSIVRTHQTGIAKKLNLPLKSKVIQWGDKIIIYTVDATSNSATPMITRKLIIDVKELGNKGVYVGIDLRNNSGTINNINDN